MSNEDRNITSTSAILAHPFGKPSNDLTAGSPGIEHTTQSFLEALAAGGGPAMETLSPQEARQVLIGAQADDDNRSAGTGCGSSRAAQPKQRA